MKPLLVDLLHIFVIFMMFAFILMTTLAATGAFDTWNQRYLRKSNRKPFDI